MTGCSRLGKAAFIAAARDERFAVCVPNQCGGGGACLAKRDYGECVGTEMRMFTHWYCKAYGKYAKNPVKTLTFDQHLLLASIAPRHLLIEGFDYPATFEESYNYAYYQGFIERFGYQKDVDWTGSRIRIPKDYDGELEKLGEFVMRRYKLHIGPAKNVNDFIDKYADGLFELIDKSYSHLYGTVPFTDAMKRQMIEGFRFIVDLRFVAVILDENDKMVAFGICFPGIIDAIRHSGGRITPGMLLRFFKAKKHPKIIDLGLVGVDPDYLNRGVSAVFASELMRMLKEDGIEYAETNLNLEDNYDIQNLWKHFDRLEHKRRRAFVKKLV